MAGGRIGRNALRGAGALVVVAMAVLGVGSASAERNSTPDSTVAAGAAVEATQTATPVPLTIPERNPVPDGGRAKDNVPKDEATTVWDLPAGSLVLNPVSGRQEVIDPDVARSAVLIGDSQSAGAQGVQSKDTWVERGLSARGYKVRFMGAGGIGFTARTSEAGNYPDSLEAGKVILPYGNPALVVVQGGGNDASSGASDAAILANADRLMRDLKASYPESDFLMIGTLARGGQAGGRRTEVNAVLAGFARSNGIPFVSPADWITRYGVAGKMADRVHLTESGHRDLAKVLSERLKELKLQGPGLG